MKCSVDVRSHFGNEQKETTICIFVSSLETNEINFEGRMERTSYEFWIDRFKLLVSRAFSKEVISRPIIRIKVILSIDILHFLRYLTVKMKELVVN